MTEKAGAATTPERGNRKTYQGKVTSDKMDKTVVVWIENRVRHPLYGRIMRRTTRVKAHDEANRCAVGDTVIIAESRPISKDKNWTLQQIIRRGTGEPVEIAEVEA